MPITPFVQQWVQDQQITMRVSMLGATGTGKTTMLTAMYERLQNSNLSVRLRDKVEIITDQATQMVLDTTYKNLVETIREGRPISRAITGTRQDVTFTFNIRKPGSQRSSILMQFHDYPGQWIQWGRDNPNDYNEEYKAVIEYVKSANVILVAVDTPYLVEENGQYHKARNMPTLMAEVVKDAWKPDDGVPRMIMLVPIKCEKYFTDNDSRERLAERVKQGYGELLEYARELPLCAVYCAPARTTGCVTFDKFGDCDENDDVPPATYKYPDNPADRTYSSVDCAQTLRYCLSLALKIHDRAQQDGGLITQILTSLFGLDRGFKDGLGILTRGCHAVTFQNMRH